MSYKRLDPVANRSRAIKIMDDWAKHGLTMAQIGKKYGLSKIRIKQIIHQERKRRNIDIIPMHRIPTLVDRFNKVFNHFVEFAFP